MARIKIKILKDLLNFKSGRVIYIDPNDTYWIRRIEDSKYDKCLEILNKPKKLEDTKKDLEKDTKKFTKNEFTKRRGNK